MNIEIAYRRDGAETFNQGNLESLPLKVRALIELDDVEAVEVTFTNPLRMVRYTKLGS